MLKTRGRAWVASLAIATIGLAALIGAALFWPGAACFDPACAQQRFNVLLEIDAFEGAQLPPFEVEQDGRNVSIESVLASGGINLQRLNDETNLPFHPSQGSLDRADLYQFLEVWRNASSTLKFDARIYALVTAAGLIADNGEPVFGIMFDYDGREGFAVAPHESVRAFGKLDPDGVGPAQMRTFLHELLHSLNRSHLDGATFPDDRVTLEAPTKCIAQVTREGWRLAESPLLALSPATIGFFQGSSKQDVLPGVGSTPFDVRRVSPRDCEIARRNRVRGPIENRWDLLAHRLGALFSMSAEAAENDLPPSAVLLQLQAQPAPYPLGYPVAIRIVATNRGEEPLPLRGRLTPSFGLVHIETKVDSADEWNELRPLAWFEPIDDSEALVPPGASVEQTVPIYFSDSGWTFPTPGKYHIRARFVLGEEQEAFADSIEIEVIAPESNDEQAALRHFADENGALDRELGKMLLFGGRIGDSDDRQPMLELMDTHPSAHITEALRLTLASHALRPALDARTGERPPPNIDRAVELLTDTCSDSGVTGLKLQLISRHTQLVSEPGNSLLPRTEFDAWEGTTRKTIGPVLTYSDPRLLQQPTSLHFCFDSDRLEGSALKEARQLARALRRQQPERIVIVGHADHAGTCNYNHTLAMRRAEAVKRIFNQAGIRSDRVIPVSMGQQRPMSFSTTDDAAGLNRRVEILVHSSSTSDAQPQPARTILPDCARHR